MITPANRLDLDALPQSERAAFMTILSGSLWRVQRNDDAREWTAIADDSLITRYGFVRADFPDVAKPTLPEWVDLPAPYVCSKAAGQLALDAAGLLDTVEAWIATQPRDVQIEYESRTEWRSDWPLIETARVALGWTQEKVYALFRSAQAL